MDVQEVLKLADELALNKTGKYLDDIQKATGGFGNEKNTWR